MIKKSILLIVILLVTSITSNSFGQWTQTNGPEGGATIGAVRIGNNIFVAGLHSIFRSSDNGLHWKEIYISGRPFTFLKAGESALYFNVENTGYSAPAVYCSRDLGKSWSPVTELGSYVTDMVISGPNIVVYRGHASITYSTDYGFSWRVDNFPENQFITLLCQEGQYVYGWSHDTKDKLYFSNNTGSTYIAVAHIDYLPTKMAVYQNTVYITSKDSLYIYKRIKDSMQFISAVSVIDVGVGIPRILAVMGSAVIVGSDYRMVISKDQGIHWTSITTPSLITDNSWLFGDNSMVYLGTSSGVFVSTDLGQHWEARNHGLISTRITKITGYGKYLFAGERYTQYFVSSDGSETWIRKTFPTTISTKLGSLACDDARLYFLSSAGTVYSSSDVGEHWDSITTPQTGINGNFVSSFSVLKDRIFIITAYLSSTLFSQTIGASTWDTMLVGSSYVVGGDNDQLLLVLKGTELSLSQDGGLNFQSGTIDVYAGLIYSITQNDLYIYLVTGSGLFRTAKSSIFFQRCANQYNIAQSVYTMDSTVITGTDGGMFISHDETKTWEYFSSEMPSNTIVTSLKRQGDFLYAGTDGYGVWKYPIAKLSVGEQHHSAQTLRVYPNPASNETAITFSTSEQSFVRVAIYDILGREVAVLCNASLSAGDHSYQWHTSSMPSGMYRCVITIDGKIQETAVAVNR